MGFVITASMFPVVVFSTLLEQQVANVRLGATIYCTLILAVMYALFIDIRAKQLRHRLINSWQKYVWYRIDAALTAQEKKAEAELAERRKSGRRLPWWKRLFY